MKRWLPAVIFLLVLVSLIGFRLVQKRAAYALGTSQRAARMKAPTAVSVAPARLQDVTATFESVGSVEAPLSVNIAAKVTGRIDFLQAHEGDRVRKGEVLVRIDPTQVEAEVRQQRAALAEVQYRLAQAQITQNPTNVSVATQVAQQEAGVASAQAGYNQASQNYQAQVDAADAAVATAAANLRSARANLENAQAKYKRVSNLFSQGFVAAQDVDDAQTAAGVQQAAVDAASAQHDGAQKQAAIARTKGKADRDAAQARVDQARAALDYAKANTAQRPAYEQTLSALRATVAAAEEGVKAAEARRADTVLLSPIDGFVTGRYLDPGAVITAGQAILAVQFMRQVWVTLAVPEEISSKMALAKPATVTLDALPGRTFTGKVTQINPSADPQSRQFSVRVTLDNADNAIKPGSYAHVAMETDRVRGALVVPREAVEHDADGDYVMVLDDAGAARRRNVTLGAAGIDVMAVTQGLRLGEKVITMSAFALRDGQKVSAGGEKRGGRTRPGRTGAPRGGQ